MNVATVSNRSMCCTSPTSAETRASSITKHAIQTHSPLAGEQSVHRGLAVSDRSGDDAGDDQRDAHPREDPAEVDPLVARRRNRLGGKLIHGSSVEPTPWRGWMRTIRGATSVQLSTAPQELALVRPAREPDERLRREPPQQPSSDRLDVPLLVEDVRGEREVEPLAHGSRQSARSASQREAVPRGVPAQQLDRVGGPVDRVDVRPARGRDERRHAQPAARARRRAARRGRRAAPRRARRRRPQLGPVRQELVVGERLLVEQRLGRGRPEQRELDLPDPHRLLAELVRRQSSASSPTVTPGGSDAELLEREQHARHVRLARRRVMANRQHLARAAEQHLLVRDEARQAHRVDRHVAAHAARRSPSRFRTARRASSSWCSSMISAAGRCR